MILREECGEALEKSKKNIRELVGRNKDRVVKMTCKKIEVSKETMNEEGNWEGMQCRKISKRIKDDGIKYW